MSKPKDKNEDNLAPALVSASRALVATMMPELVRYGFKGITPAFASLMSLLDTAGIRPTTLAQRAGTTKQAIGQLVRELETRGYVEQVPDSTDTRAKIVRLTKRGVALYAACANARNELQATVIAKLGKMKVSRLRRDLVELAAVLEKMRTRWKYIDTLSFRALRRTPSLFSVVKSDKSPTKKRRSKLLLKTPHLTNC